MPRAWIRVAVATLVVLSVGTFAFRPASAQEATPTARTGHPLVGAWILDRDTTHPTNQTQKHPSFLTLHTIILYLTQNKRQQLTLL